MGGGDRVVRSEDCPRQSPRIAEWRGGRQVAIRADEGGGFDPSTSSGSSRAKSRDERQCRRRPEGVNTTASSVCWTTSVRAGRRVPFPPDDGGFYDRTTPVLRRSVASKPGRRAPEPGRRVPFPPDDGVFTTGRRPSFVTRAPSTPTGSAAARRGWRGTGRRSSP